MCGTWLTLKLEYKKRDFIFYLKVQEFLGPLSRFSSFSLSITQNLTQVDMGWSADLSAVGWPLGVMTSQENVTLPPGSSSSDLQAGTSWPVMNHPFWNKTWYLRHILLTVWCCPLKILYWKTRCRNIWNSQNKNNLYMHLLQNHVSRGY